MSTKDLVDQIRLKKSFLCIGLDTDLAKIPEHLLQKEDPIFEFNRIIIDATHQFCVAFKPNTAFYEAHGVKGWIALEKTISYINNNYPEIFTIADAKRGDIGNTSAMYAKTFLNDLDFDSVTVAPYMGYDSVAPFLAIENKFTILLALTSNDGAFDFETLSCDQKPLYQHVLEKSQKWENAHQLMYVVGATKSNFFEAIRKIVPHNFLLVPGIGSQGGDLEAVCEFGLTDDIGLLINSSRNIIYASNLENFATAASDEAQKLQTQMAMILQKHLKWN